MGEIDAVKLEAHVRTLASAEFSGRGTPDDRENAAKWVSKQLAAAGLKPVPGEPSLLRPFAAVQAKGVPAGNNVVGWIPGMDANEYVIVSAHFDHLEPRTLESGVRTQDGPVADARLVFPGADDNASGTAALIEIARALASGPKTRRSVMVLAFDLEEHDCGGSRAYAAAPARPLDACAVFTTMGMMGRSLADIYPGLLMVMGAERADALLVATGAMPAAEGTSIRELGMDFNQLGWSDYVPFEEKKVPSLFFTSGACRDYHQPTDVADKIDFPALRSRTATVLAAIRALADGTEKPVWKTTAVPRMGEIESLHAIVQKAGEKADELGLTEGMRVARKNFEGRLANTIASGNLTVGARVAVRNLALMIFQAATRAR